MQNFDEISEDIAWRHEQLLIAKTIPYMHSFSDSHKEFLIKHSIPIIYAVWEGFVQQSFQTYVRELNKLGLSREQYCLNILTHSIDASFPQLKEYPNEFTNRMKFAHKLDLYFKDEFRISPKINTESNVELEVINKILCRFNLKQLPNFPYKDQLKSLLMFRNRIAHGDNTLVISNDNMEEFKNKIDSFVNLIIELMDEVYKIICAGYSIDKNYLRVV